MKYLLYKFCLFLIILFFAYVNSSRNVENFTPKIREMYRPYVRNARIIKDGFYNNSYSSISNLFRKFGII